MVTRRLSQKTTKIFWAYALETTRRNKTAECLNLPVALRIWKEHWTTERVCLEVRADNVTALTLVWALKGSSPAINQIARELALDLGDASFRPDVISHTPGVASCVTDALSRRYEQGTEFVLPHQLEHVPECWVTTRRLHMVEIHDTARDNMAMKGRAG